MGLYNSTSCYIAFPGRKQCPIILPSSPYGEVYEPDYTKIFFGLKEDSTELFQGRSIEQSGV